MAAGTTQVTLPVGVFTSLGTATAGMVISPQAPIMIIAASSLPSATAVGHPVGGPRSVIPYFFPLNQQVWAIPVSAVNGTTATVSI